MLVIFEVITVVLLALLAVLYEQAQTGAGAITRSLFVSFRYNKTLYLLEK